MTEVVPPTERECERCGRTEEWDEEQSTWTVAASDGNAGTAHCLHEWDINGTYNPLAK